MDLPVKSSRSQGDAGSWPHTAMEGERFVQLYRGHAAFVWRTLRRFGVPEASLEDAMQDVFLVAHRRLRDFDGASPRAWLAAIARRVAADTRRRTRQHPVCDRESHHDLALARQAFERSHEERGRESAAKLVHRLMECLDDERREVFVLAELEGMSMPEVAEALEVKLNTAYSRLRSARLRVKAEYARLIAREKWRMP